MIAHALPAVLAAGHADRSRAADMITLTCNEIRRLFTVLILEPTLSLACPLTWSACDAATNTAPEPATTSDRTPNINVGNDL